MFMQTETVFARERAVKIAIVLVGEATCLPPIFCKIAGGYYPPLRMKIAITTVGRWLAAAEISVGANNVRLRP